MFGSLLVLTTNRSNIMFSTCLCARFRKDPNTIHSEGTVWIHQRVLHIQDYGIPKEREQKPQCMPTRIIPVIKLIEKAQVVLALLINTFLPNDSLRSLRLSNQYQVEKHVNKLRQNKQTRVNNGIPLINIFILYFNKGTIDIN